MPLLFKMYQMDRTFKDGRQDNANGKWFARAIHVGVADTDQIAQEISYATTATKSDVQAVLTALVEVMKKKLADSYIVKLDGFGSFKVGIKCTGATDVKEFSASENITGAHINFMPSYTVNTATGARQTPMLDGVRFSETAKNDVGIEKA